MLVVVPLLVMVIVLLSRRRRFLLPTLVTNNMIMTMNTTMFSTGAVSIFAPPIYQFLSPFFSTHTPNGTGRCKSGAQQINTYTG